MFAFCNIPLAMLFMTTSLEMCSTPHQVNPSRSGATSFHILSCPSGSTTMMELRCGVGRPQAKMVQIATVLTQDSVVFLNKCFSTCHMPLADF